VEAAKDAGVTKIDHLITTHWHGDHFGGLAEVAKQIPIAHYYDHGPNVQATPATDEFFKTVYEPLTGKAMHTVVKPGDSIPVKDLNWRVVASAGNVLKTNLSGAGRPNPYCADSKPQDPDPTENAQSVSSYITFGKFHVVHMGDLTFNKELDLMCPNNRLGTADLFIVSHHGQAILEFPRARACAAPARRHHQQRHAEGWPAGCDARALLVARTRRRVADALLTAERAGIHRAGRLHCEPDRSAGYRYSGGSLDSAAAGTAGAAGAGAQRQSVLLQDRRAAGWHVHDH
jgi:hypothetical protein